MSENHEIDYKKMFLNAVSNLRMQHDLQEEYFDLNSKLNELRPFSDIVGKRIFELSMKEQVSLLRLLLPVQQFQKKLCIEHGWDASIEESTEE